MFIVKELIKELKKRNPDSKVYIMVNKTIKKWLYENIELPEFEDEQWNDDTSFTMISIEK